MSTLREFLIKNAGMEKSARTAIAKRLLASTMTPEEVVKRFGKVKGQQYLDDITAAIKNYVNSPSVASSASDAAKTRNYLRRMFDNNMSHQLYFNNKLSKSDFLKPVGYGISRPNITQYQSWLNSDGFMSGLSFLYDELPRQDKLIVSKYLRGAVPESGLQHLSKDVQQAARTTRASLVQRAASPVLPEKSKYAKTLQQQYGLKSREELIKEIQDSGIDFNPVELQHSYYVAKPHSYLSDYNPKHKLLAATKLPFTTIDRLPAQTAALNDVLTTSGQFNSLYRGANMDKLPRSAQKALQVIKGENLLEPGTRANRLFNKVYNNKALYNKLGLTDVIQPAVDGKNAGYWPDLDALLVHPNTLGAKNTAGMVAHERGHRAAFTMAPDTHADDAFRTFRKMQLLGKKHNMNVPLDNSQLMQEAFAESYIPKLLGPNSGAALFASPRQHLRAAAALFPGAVSKEVRKGTIQQYRANRDAINAMRTSEDTKDLFRQLAFNYGHPLV
jgi:hypothetical protein